MKVGHIRLGLTMEPWGGPPVGAWGTVGHVITMGRDDDPGGPMTFYVAIFDHESRLAPTLPMGTWIVTEDAIDEKRECSESDGLCS